MFHLLTKRPERVLVLPTKTKIFLLVSKNTFSQSKLKAGSHRSRQRQRYRSVAVTSNVTVFTQKILAVTEVIFLISSVLR